MVSSDWRSQIFEIKNLATQILVKWAKISPETRFFAVFKFGSLFFFEIICNDSLEQFLASSRGKIQKHLFESPDLGPRDQNWTQN